MRCSKSQSFQTFGLYFKLESGTSDLGYFDFSFRFGVIKHAFIPLISSWNYLVVVRKNIFFFDNLIWLAFAIKKKLNQIGRDNVDKELSEVFKRLTRELEEFSLIFFKKINGVLYRSMINPSLSPSIFDWFMFQPRNKFEFQVPLIQISKIHVSRFSHKTNMSRN